MGKMYFDWFDRDYAVYDEERSTFDFEFQHHFAWGKKHDLVWGLGYRFTDDEMGNTFTAMFDPLSREDHLFSAFFSDDISLIEDHLILTLGSKFEHNDYSGFEVQPSARMMWIPHPRHKIWAAISRAVRTPSRYEHDSQINLETLPPGTGDNPLPLPIIFTPTSTDTFDSEDLLAFETGYRIMPTEWLNFDTALFYNIYNNLLTAEPNVMHFVAKPSPGFFRVPLIADNKLEGETYGFELAADCRLKDWWTLHLAYSFLRVQLHRTQGSRGFVFEDYERRSPIHQVSLRSSFNLSKNMTFDMWLRNVDNILDNYIPEYTTIDLSLGWKPNETLEFTLGAQNLLDNQHIEYWHSLIKTEPLEIQRSVYLKMTLHF